MIRLGILGSTRGTNLIALVNAINKKQLNASIEIVISNKANALILEKAKNCGIQAVFVNPIGFKREEFDKKISALLEQYQVELVVLIGYMRILSAEFISTWKHKVINSHPSLLPAFAGLMDLDVHRAVLNSTEKTTGCTIHYVTEQVDLGPIIAQKSCRVLSGDTPESLKERVQKIEGDLLVHAIQTIICLL